MYKAQYIDYNPHKGPTGEWITVHELHGTEESARVRAKVKGWSLVHLETLNPSLQDGRAKQWCLVSVKPVKRGMKR